MNSASRESLLSSLNQQQRAAVSADPGNMLIVAGAGTGKTRVLVSRVAWLLSVEAIPARRILALTFTNKAAEEMYERISALNLSGVDLRGMWCGTFHSICARFLRSYALQAGIDPGFSILDTDGQKTLVDTLLKQEENQSLKLQAAELKLRPAKIAHIIAGFKERGLRASELARVRMQSPEVRLSAEIYKQYEHACKAGNMLDFGELILRTAELFAENAQLLELQHKRFAEILVDEFQDTNSLQYRLIKLLKGPQCHVFAVGDDDQSIYGWRGADYTNLQRFISDFAPVNLFKLEENYRSTSQILQAANALICRNQERITDKQLVAVQGSGEKVHLLGGFDDNGEEALGIVRRIRQLMDSGLDPADIAVLYRNNSRSAALEQAFLIYKVPYYIYGGMRFFDRKEVQDALAYLRLAVNTGDDAAFSRIINTPPRGIGPVKLETLAQVARERGCSRLEALRLTVEYARTKDAGSKLKALAQKAEGFVKLINEIKERAAQGELSSQLLRDILEHSGLLLYYQQQDAKENNPEGQGRVQNLEELVNNAVQVEQREDLSPTSDAQGQPLSPVIAFLSNAALLSAAELNSQGSFGEQQASRVRLFTIHSAKGLEFDTVFVSGFEKGLLPYAGLGSDNGNEKRRYSRSEEERRLAYVAITRAKRQLYLCYANYTFSYLDGGMVPSGPSEFLREIADSLGSSAAFNQVFCRD